MPKIKLPKIKLPKIKLPKFNFKITKKQERKAARPLNNEFKRAKRLTKKEGARIKREKIKPIKIKLPKALGRGITLKPSKPKIKKAIPYKGPTKRDLKEQEKRQAKQKQQKAEEARKIKSLNQKYKRAEKRSAKATAEYNRLMKNAKNRERYAEKKEQEKKEARKLARAKNKKVEKLTRAEKKRAREIIKELEEDQKPARGKKSKKYKYAKGTRRNRDFDDDGGTDQALFYDGIKDLKHDIKTFKIASYPMSNKRDATNWFKKVGAGKSYFAILKQPNKRTGTSYYYIVDIDPNRTRAGSKQKVNKYASHRAEQIYQKFINNNED